MLGEILVVFFNTLPADSMDPVQDCEKLQLPIEMQLSQKGTLFLNFLLDFLNLHQISHIFFKKHDCHSLCISQITDCENLA